MGTATVYFSPEHNTAAIVYDQRLLAGRPPTDAINHALERLYKNPDLGPYIYEAWNGDTFLGLVLSEPFGATEDARITLEFDRIVTCNREAPELAEFAPKEVPI